MQRNRLSFLRPHWMQRGRERGAYRWLELWFWLLDSPLHASGRKRATWTLGPRSARPRFLKYPNERLYFSSNHSPIVLRYNSFSSYKAQCVLLWNLTYFTPLIPSKNGLIASSLAPSLTPLITNVGTSIDLHFSAAVQSLRLPSVWNSLGPFLFRN